LTAIGFAGNIVQFADFGLKLVKVGVELYESSHLESHTTAEAAAERVKYVAARAVRDPNSFRAKFEQVPEAEFAGFRDNIDEDELELQSLCNECTKIATTLIDRVKSLGVSSESSIFRAWKSSQIALRSMWSRREIAQLEEQLKEHRSAIDSRVLISLG
jgi:hypothetical protein